MSGVSEKPWHLTVPRTVPLIVSDCVNVTISDIISGRYVPHGTNHQRVVYKKESKNRGVDVLIYFWDDRDGADLSGWWFGPSVGGEQVWAYHPSRTAATPPASDWNVPHDGAIDPTFSVAADRSEQGRKRERERVSESKTTKTLRREGRERVEPVDCYVKEHLESERREVEGSASGTHAYFVDFYKKRREESSKIEDTGLVVPKKASSVTRSGSSVFNWDSKVRDDDRRVREQGRSRDAASGGRKERKQRVRDELMRDEDSWERERPEDPRRECDTRRDRLASRREREEDHRDAGNRLGLDDSRREGDRFRREDEKETKEEERRRYEEELQKSREEKRRREVERLREQRRTQEREGALVGREQGEEMGGQAGRAQASADDDKRRLVDALKRQHDEATIARQQQATLAVLRVLQKLSNADPANFEILQDELDTVLATELPETGAQQDILKAEANRVLEYAKQLVEQVKEQQLKWEELRLEQQRKLQAQEETARRLLEQLSDHIVAAEAASEDVHFTAAPFAGEHQMENNQVLIVARAVDTAGKAAMSACSTCADFLLQARATIQEAESLRGAVASALNAAQPRLQAATHRAAEALQRAKTNKERVMKSMAAAKHTERCEKVFRRYDRDGDGLLRREELRAYAKGEFDFELPEENLDRIFRQLLPANVLGITPSEFHLVRTAVGIARNDVRGRQKCVEKTAKDLRDRAEATARRAFVAERRKEFTAVSDGLMSTLGDLENEVLHAEHLSTTFSDSASTMGVQELTDRFMKVDTCVQKTRIEVSDAQARVQALVHSVSEIPELLDPMRPSTTMLGSRAEMFDMRLLKAAQTASGSLQLARYMAFTRYEGERLELAVALRALVEEDGKVDTLFERICRDGRTVTRDDISAYLRARNCPVEEEKLDHIFSRESFILLDSSESLAGCGETSLPGPSACNPPRDLPALAETPAEEPHVAKNAAGLQSFEPVVKEESASNAAHVDAALAATDHQTVQAEAAPAMHDGLVTLSAAVDGTMEGAGEAAVQVEAPPEATPEARPVESETQDEHVAPNAASDAAIEAAGREAAQALAINHNDVLRVTRADFERLVRVYYKVVKEIVLSDNLAIEQSQQIRRMETGEVLEVFRGPVVDPSVGVHRVHGKALKDGTVGWVTVAGNQGITFLVPGGSVFKVLAAAPLSAELKEDGQSCVRMLTEGEVLEVLGWSRTSRSAVGVTRIKARAALDRAVGWVTVVGNDGSVYLEAT